MLKDRKARRAKAVKENSSKFVEDFSRQCQDTGITETGVGIQLFARSKAYYDNFDKINWGHAND
jgi:hypothetical protein